MAQTKSTDLINPEVLEDAISGQLESKIRFAPYARIDSTLEAQPGDTITRPRYAYVGAAEDLEEGVPMDPAALSMTTTQVTVKEAGKAVEVTEKAIITNLDGTMEEAGNQITLSIADKLEIDYLASLASTQQTFNGEATTAQNIIDAIDVFGDEDDGNYVLFLNPSDYTALSKSLIEGNTFLSRAQIAELVGVQDIVKTNRLAVGTSYIQKQGAVEIVYKKRPSVNEDHDILARTHVLAGNQYYTTNLFNESGVVKLEASAA
ncbi:N4-gp56 family major capsid protein [Virgibacillus sp. CBA3643]|uniref:N4-gp56 family major capsid protein n=1 Tax=Virgibacillus sp. CBA3643 TaxID=2942278 RepID=UPI0035A3665B